MFDFSVIHEPVATRQRASINQTIDRALATGTLTSTDILMSPEPLQTMALEYLDALSSESGIPQTKGSVKDTWPVRLVCIKATDTLTISKWGSKNIYGTTVEAPQQKISESLGNVADVDNSYPDRFARNILRAKGFPVRNVKSKGTNEGTVVEWKWLERRAKEVDAPAEIRELYDQLLARITAPNAPAPNKSKPAGQAPAHP